MKIIGNTLLLTCQCINYIHLPTSKDDVEEKFLVSQNVMTEINKEKKSHINVKSVHSLRIKKYLLNHNCQYLQFVIYLINQITRKYLNNSYVHKIIEYYLPNIF